MFSMKKIILFLFLCFSLTGLKAQTTNINSLKLVLQKEKQDTTRVLLLSELSFSYVASKPDSAMNLAMEALQLSRRIGFVKGEAVSLNRIGNAYGVFGNYPKRLEVLLKALKINEKINNRDGLSRNYINIGLAYSNMGDSRQALRYYFKSKALSEQINEKQLLSISLETIARAYKNLKILDSAMIFAQQANILANQINYSRMIGFSLQEMGNIHSETGQNTLALEYYRLSVPQLKKAEDLEGLGQSFLGMAKVFEKTGQIDSSLFYAGEGITIAQKSGFLRQVLDISSFLSVVYKNKSNVDSAYFYLELSKTVNDSLFSQQKQQQLQNLAFDEKLRQQELAFAEFKAKQERNMNLQYAAIAVGLITFIILFVALSRSIIVKPKFIEFFSVLGLLALFEFINLFMHPHLAHLTHDSPILMLLILIGIGALLVPLHHQLEKWITEIMVEKNKKIRLAAAKKTIATLEGA